MADGLKKWMGGSPLAVVGRLVLVSILVGIVLAALGLDPFDIISSVERLIRSIWNMGFDALRWLWRYFLLGAVIIIPIWLIMRLLNAPSVMVATKKWVKERYDEAPDGALKKLHDRAAHRDQELKMTEPEMTDHQQLTSLLERAGKFAELTTPKAILVASIILVAGILFLFRYELTPIQNAQGVIRLDRLTGTISFCRINASMEYGC